MAGMVLVALAFNVGAQTQEELAAQLKSPIATERLIALAAIEKLKKPDASLLDLVAPSLLDDSEDVRTTAAYAIAAIAGRVGCKVEALSECALLRTVFDATPKATTSVPLRYPIEARQAWVQGVVKVEFLITPVRTTTALHQTRRIPVPFEVCSSAARTRTRQSLRSRLAGERKCSAGNLAIMCSIPTPAMWKEAEKKYGPHMRRFIRVTGNSSAVAAFAVPKQKRRFPVGASIAKAKFINSADGGPDGVGFMTKREGPEFKDTGGWEFSYFPNTGNQRKTHEACASCHRGAASTDFIFGHYEP
jgi:hypothetical protein